MQLRRSNCLLIYLCPFFGKLPNATYLKQNHQYLFLCSSSILSLSVGHYQLSIGLMKIFMAHSCPPPPIYTFILTSKQWVKPINFNTETLLLTTYPSPLSYHVPSSDHLQKPPKLSLYMHSCFFPPVHFLPRMSYKCKSDHITPLLKTLHCLSIISRLIMKFLSMDLDSCSKVSSSFSARLSYTGLLPVLQTGHHLSLL